MRCSKSCYLYDLELVDLFENTVIEQVEYKLRTLNNRKIEKLKNLHKEDGAVQKLQFLDSFLRF